MNRCVLFYVAVGLINLVSYARAEECGRLPKCSSLGYKYSRCVGAKLLCPFDDTKQFCLEESPVDNCAQYSILYDDRKCYDTPPAGRVPIAIVVSQYRALAIALDEPEKMPWSKNGVLENVPTLDDSSGGLGGAIATDAIVAYFGGSSDYAAGYCHNYTTTGTKRGEWFLPTYEMVSSRLQMDRVTTAAEKVGGDAMVWDFGERYWLAEEIDEEDAAVKGQQATDLGKNYLARVRCMINY